MFIKEEDEYLSTCVLVFLYVFFYTLRPNCLHFFQVNVGSVLFVSIGSIMFNHSIYTLISLLNIKNIQNKKKIKPLKL